MTLNHPENFSDNSSLPIDDEYVAGVLNDEFGIPDGIEDVAPRVDAARKVLTLARALDHDSDDSFPLFVRELLAMIQDDDGNMDFDMTLEVTYRLARMVEGLLAFTREFCTDEDDEEREGAKEFDDMFFSMLDREVTTLMKDEFSPYWDSSRACHSEGVNLDEETLRTFRFNFTHDVESESLEFALVELAETVTNMLEPSSRAPAWTMTEFSDVVMFEETGDVVSTRRIHLGENSARLKGFLGILNQTEFVFQDDN